MANQFEEMLKKMPPKERAALDKRINQDKRGAEKAGKAQEVTRDPAAEKAKADPGKSANKPTQKQASGHRVAAGFCVLFGFRGRVKSHNRSKRP